MTKWLILFTVVLLSISSTSFAHHGWRWTSDTDVEVIGIIESVSLGNPHGVLILDVEGEKWTAEVGQPWRNERAGLSEDLLVIGNDITIEGQRSADPKELLVKAETVIIKGKRYVLYPDRI
jgi:hypothetical protein